MCEDMLAAVDEASCGASSSFYRVQNQGSSIQLLNLLKKKKEGRKKLTCLVMLPPSATSPDRDSAERDLTMYSMTVEVSL
jgi:hypothetical protein